MSEAGKAFASARLLFISGVEGVYGRRPLPVAVFSAWLLAALLDAITTIRMNGRGFEEANTPVAFLMGAFGTVPVVLAVSVLVLILGLWCAGRPTDLYSGTVLACLVAVLVLKVLTGVSNLTLMHLGVDFF